MKPDTENTSSEQLSAELARLRQRVDELETLEASHIRTEAALRASQERYQDLYQEAPLAYFSVNMADQRIQAANRQAVELSGYPQAELVGRLVFDLYADTPAGKPRARNLFRRFREGERIQGEELEMQRADGQRLWVSLSAVPILDESGQVVASRSAVLDITKRKEAEEALRESIRVNQALLTAVPDMMFRIGQDGFIRDFKPARTFDPLLSPDDFLGKRIEEVMPAEHAQQSHYHLQLALQTGRVHCLSMN
jgi:PAS domain S-box-containing protein